jgi:hypothetical protein
MTQASGSAPVGFVVYKVALGLDFLRIFRFSPVNVIPPWLSILITWGWAVGTLQTAVQRQVSPHSRSQ